MEIANIPQYQRDLLAKLTAGKRVLGVSWDKVRGAFFLIRCDNLAVAKPTEAGDPERARIDLLTEFMSEQGELFGLKGNGKALYQPRTRKGPKYYHTEYQQFADTKDAALPPSVEVYGSRLAAHFAENGNLVEVLSSYYPDIRPNNAVKTDPGSLRASVRESIAPLDGFRDLEARIAENEEFFPLSDQPRLVIYPWQGRPMYAWATHGYGALQSRGPGDGRPAERSIAFGQMFFNAETGELFLFAPMNSRAENGATGSGLSTLPLGGNPFTNRTLQVVRINAGPIHQLKDTTRGREIFTYSANADPALSDNPNHAIVFDRLAISENTGPHWIRVAQDTTNPQRTASQQPEVDGHATCGELYDWYHEIGGRVGWDNDEYSATKVPSPRINLVAHAFDTDVHFHTSRSANSYFDLRLVGLKWRACIVCFDGDPTGTTQPGTRFDYPAGSRALLAHEYQHGVTKFAVQDQQGNPGVVFTHSAASPDGTNLPSWGGAIQEGLSDVFAGLFSGDWWMGQEISPVQQIWRNLAFPRDPNALSKSMADHWGDRDAAAGRPDEGYFRGCILAHAAYLMAEGGVHQRNARTPALISVRGLGRESGGQNVYKAARFWYCVITDYLPTIGAFTGDSAQDEIKFRMLRQSCVNAAMSLHGPGSPEYKIAMLAWYAVGLQPDGESYGADVTFLTWGADWRLSRPFVGIPIPDDTSAPDLFINNSGRSEWKALVNVASAPTQFENNVFVRVRNVGDQPATGVTVQVEYTKILPGGAAAGWQPVVDKSGSPQPLNIGTIGAGGTNFPDSEQDHPPALAGVKWCIPPLLPGELVDHFRIRAHVTASNDVNDFNNDVQSNIAHSNFVPGTFV